MTALISIAVIAPLLGGGVSLALRNHRSWRDAAVLSGLGLPAASALVMLAAVAADGTHTVAVGGWAPELGIVLVADMFAALMLPVALTTIFVVEIFAIGQRRARWGADPALSGPLMCVLTSGVSLAFLTGDLFTLFIAFELILVSSYVLLTHQGAAGQVRSGMTYVVMNLLASTLFLFGVAFVYSATGTVNLALLAERIPQLGDGVRFGIGTWFLVVFGTKAAVFPLFSWLPDSYPTAPTTITAVFAGLLTKIGIYAMIRFHTLTVMDDLGPVMLMVAAITMVVGGLGALAQSDIKRILSFHVISQIGYMLMGLGLFSVAGTAAAILFLIHIMPVKAVLFLVGGLIENNEGSSSLDRSGGLAARKPLIAVMFAVPALSLAGIPPFSGFVAKLAVVSAAIDASATVAVVAALVAGALTLLSMWKIWNAVFWSRPAADPSPGPAVRSGAKTMHSATALAVIGTLVVSLLAGPLLDLSTQAAEDLRDRSVYIEAVLP
ncbi:MAG: proton-conducting transporter membrane subunit [Acidimicrobiaceae bacterium]|nr:proton-conducting transporter membrane subunit [Acidimicrobiaceae bacterium]MCY4280925.1 proton-conducting transporter membrane subunit [Acidimicrobiaceae bacterium]MCY4294787.1 proton-conducting transporter membrane subunit [Acidimicrobiaceae bacterium]